MKFRKRDYLLAPIYLYQAHQIKRTAISLPEPNGERIGTTTVQSAGQSLKLMIIGDSAGAGVGVAHQDDAALGRIIHHLSAHIADFSFGTIEWQLHATTGHTSLDILKNLQNINDTAIDYVIISVGVNDVVKKTSEAAWRQAITSMVQMIDAKFGARQVYFLSLPPMQLMPSLPYPLNHFLGYQAKRLDRLLYQSCEMLPKATYLADEFDKAALDSHQMFAKDGFHPSAITYDIWSRTIAQAIYQDLMRDQHRFSQSASSHQNTTSTRLNNAT